MLGRGGAVHFPSRTVSLHVEKQSRTIMAGRNPTPWPSAGRFNPSISGRLFLQDHAVDAKFRCGFMQRASICDLRESSLIRNCHLGPNLLIRVSYYIGDLKTDPTLENYPAFRWKGPMWAMILGSRRSAFWRHRFQR